MLRFFLKIFPPKSVAKKLAFSAQNTASFCKIWIITLAFKKNADFFAENFDLNIDPRAQNYDT
jgi:hypothetical protein